MNDMTDNDLPDDRSLPVDMGSALPPGQAERLPLLDPALQAVAGSEPAHAGSAIAQGIHFTGSARLNGPCSIAGEFDGELVQVPGSEVAVVVTETGIVKGDITAQRISVRGHVEGVLDAGTGEVSLHDGAQVQGRVRYGRIQVNGADLNATLERVVAPKR
jgi:cytoskeletal protein CcmA (bactofilin family)